EAEDPLFDMRETAEFLAGLNPHGDLIVVPVAPEAVEEPETGQEEMDREARINVGAGETSG
ncbi:MAG TPA: hypothetical protein VHE81_09150, partial [Lacipirellulaceae bacterium]|nr:hypothetical protein [Lacipirellulaceae bacterium]